MEIYKTTPPLPHPPLSHSCGLYPPPPPPPEPQLPPDISPMDEVLSVLINQHQNLSLSLPPKHPPPPPQLPPDIFPSDEILSFLVNQHEPHFLSLRPTTSPSPPQLPPDISPSDEVFTVLVNQHLPRAFSFSMNPPPPIPTDNLNDGDIKKCLISELSSSADSLIDKFGRIVIIDGDHFPKFTGSLTVSKGVMADSLIDKVGEILIIGGTHFPEFTGFVTVSKGVVDGEEHIDAGEGEGDGYEADDERSDLRDGDNNQQQDVGDNQFGGHADPNNSGSLYPSDLEGNSESIGFYGIYRRNESTLLGKIYHYEAAMLDTFQKWETYVRQYVAKLNVEDLPEHYDVVFEKNIERNEKFVSLPSENNFRSQLSRIILETPQIRYDIFLHAEGTPFIFRRIGSISQSECAAMGSRMELQEHVLRMVYNMKIEEYVIVSAYVWFKYSNQRNEDPFCEIPKDFPSLLRLLSRIVIEVIGSRPHSQPNEASESGTKRLTEASRSGTKRLTEASGSGTKTKRGKSKRGKWIRHRESNH